MVHEGVYVSLVLRDLILLMIKCVALRLNTIVPGTFRSACKDTILPLGGGENGQSPVFVKAGTIVSTFFGALHARRDIWGDDRLEYNPDRWTKLRPGAWDYLPFSGGPRICLGRKSLTQMQI